MDLTQMPEDFHIIQFPMFEDNYGYLLRDLKSGRVATVDPGDGPRVMEALDRQGWQLDEIWITHHHADHVGGNSALKQRYGAKVIGPRAEADKIPGLDEELVPGQTVRLGEVEAHVMDVGGHTLGHIAYWFARQKILFCGDTVFGLGCGRLFEGTPSQMWASLQRVSALPQDTRLYCAHEYLESNAGFALAADPDNQALATRVAQAHALRLRGVPTVPMLLSEEKKTNPFFRAEDSEFLQKRYPGRSAVEAFADLRARRNHWKS